MKFNVTGCCFIDKYFEIIGTERSVSTQKDVGDDSNRNGYYGQERFKKILNTLWTIYLRAFHALVLIELQALRIRSYLLGNGVVRRRSADVLR